MLREIYRRRQIWLKAVLAAVCGLGCRGIWGGQGIPDDPMFASRKPVEAKAAMAAPVALAFVEPPIPLDAPMAVASGKEKPPPGKATPLKVELRGTLTSQPGSKVDGSYLPSIKPQ